MLKGKDFIIFSDDWGRHPFSCQHIMEHFLPHNKLLWVNTIGMRTPTLSLYDMKRAYGKIVSWLGPQRQKSAQIPLHPNLRILSPFMIPYNIYAPVRSFNTKNVVKNVLNAAEDWGFHDPILLTTQPLAADYLGKLKESLIVYYCVDDFIFWPGMNQPELVKSMEDALMQKSDLIFAVSDSLCTSRTNGKEATKLLTHGVDIPHFAKASQQQERPQNLERLTGPIIGFYGLIDQRFDKALVEEVLKAKPEWHVVCIGKSIVDLSTLCTYDNFHWIDAVPYESLPAYASYFDVACIPYVINEHTHTINPLKLKEYMATGKPIVTTPMREALHFKDIIHIAEKGPAFIQAMEHALHNPIDSQTRAAALLGESWHEKAELVASWIEEKINPAGANATHEVHHA